MIQFSLQLVSSRIRGVWGERERRRMPGVITPFFLCLHHLRTWCRCQDASEMGLACPRRLPTRPNLVQRQLQYRYPYRRIQSRERGGELRLAPCPCPRLALRRHYPSEKWPQFGHAQTCFLPILAPLMQAMGRRVRRLLLPCLSRLPWFAA